MTCTRSVAAKAILRAATARRPKTRYMVGYGARPLILLSRIIPDRVFDAVTRRLFAPLRLTHRQASAKQKGTAHV
jgi:hypothetical protein